MLYSTGNYTQYYVITYKEKNLKKNIYIYIYVCIYIYIYIKLNQCAVYLRLTLYYKLTILQ